MAELPEIRAVERRTEHARAQDPGNRPVLTKEDSEPERSDGRKDKFTPSENTNISAYPKISGNNDSTKEETKKASGKKELTDSEKREVENLKNIDNETRTHESAHIAAGGNLVKGGATFNYQKGPDGKSYAVGGEVQIDISPEKDPEDTILKMDRVRRAAMAPADPSSQDRQVAAKAAQIQAQARSEKMKANTGADFASADYNIESNTNDNESGNNSSKNILKADSLIKAYKKNEPATAGPGEIIDFSISEINIQKLDSK